MFVPTSRHAIVLLLLTFCRSPLSVEAKILFRESFDYERGALVEVSAGTWTRHSGNTNEVGAIEGQGILKQAYSEDVSAEIGEAPFASDSGRVLYLHFRFTFTALPRTAGSYFIHFKGGNTFRGRVFLSPIPETEDRFQIGVANGDNAPSALFPTSLSIDTPYTAVLRYAVSEARSTLWLDPSTESDASVTASDAASVIGISDLALREATGMGSVSVDDIRVIAQQTPVAFTTTPNPEWSSLSAGIGNHSSRQSDSPPITALG